MVGLRIGGKRLPSESGYGVTAEDPLNRYVAD
jgi:hypothetical protein